MKRIIIIFYHIFFFTVTLRFIYVSTIHVIRNACVDIFTLFYFMYLSYLFKGFSRTHFLLLVSSFTFRNAVHFIKKPKQDLHRCYNTVNICRNVKCNRPCSKFGLDGFLVKWQQYPASLCITLSISSDLASSLRGIGGFQYGC